MKNRPLANLLLTGLLAAPLASAFKLTEVKNRVFSPRAAGSAASRVTFTFSNPGGDEVTIRIFDIGGALVRRNLEYSGADLVWNGRDQSGSFVRGGVYIYQVEAGDKVLTGTVVVAL